MDSQSVPSVNINWNDSNRFDEAIEMQQEEDDVLFLLEKEETRTVTLPIPTSTSTSHPSLIGFISFISKGKIKDIGIQY